MSGTLIGLAFPFAIDPRTGAVATASGNDKLRQNLKHLLLTGIGERLMQRQYGGGVTQLLQENLNDGLIAVAKHQIARAVVTYEPRVMLQEITAIPGNGTLTLRMTYLQAGTPGLQTVAIPLG
jgi:phage baseplate assembly protein W